MTYRVELEDFRGPLDLLVHLVRKHEVDVCEIPLARILRDYLEYLEVLQELNLNAIGEFLDLASILVEIKSREALPHGGEEEVPEEPRNDLVKHLLQYKQFRDAASILEERGREWQKRLPRLSRDLPPRSRDLAEEPIQEVELWDLVSAFGRILRDNVATQGTNIVYDDTPIEVHMNHISQLLNEVGQLRLGELFRPGMHKSTLVGLFLAVLELVRHFGLQTEQSENFGEIVLYPGVPLSSSELIANGPPVLPK